MKVIIDRFEENIAVVELDGEMLHAPRALFAEAREGDTVELTVLPHKGDTDTEEQIQRLRGVTLSRFKEAEQQEEDSSDDAPAALFAKLRKKKKH